MTIVLATHNPHKVQELRDLLPDHLRILTSADLGIRAPEETGATFAENAYLKAEVIMQLGYVALADDSGLEVDSLDGAPGVMSSRFAGEPSDDAANNRKLLAELSAMPTSQRVARFTSIVVLMTPSGEKVVARGTIHGRIVTEPRGKNGFGYDPYFEIVEPDTPDLHGMTMAELTLLEKNQISHRARAYQALLSKVASTDMLGSMFRRK